MSLPEGFSTAEMRATLTVCTTQTGKLVEDVKNIHEELQQRALVIGDIFERVRDNGEQNLAKKRKIIKLLSKLIEATKENIELRKQLMAIPDAPLEELDQDGTEEEEIALSEKATALTEGVDGKKGKWRSFLAIYLLFAQHFKGVDDQHNFHSGNPFSKPLNVCLIFRSLIPTLVKHYHRKEKFYPDSFDSLE